MSSITAMKGCVKMKYNLGHGIKMQRKKKKVSQLTLGNVLGVSRSAISNWEIGRRDVTTREAVAMANYFEISLDELVDPKD